MTVKEVWFHPRKRFWEFWKRKKLLIRNIDYTIEHGIIHMKKKMDGKVVVDHYFVSRKEV